jgi:hypothetical protein
VNSRKASYGVGRVAQCSFNHFGFADDEASGLAWDLVFNGLANEVGLGGRNVGVPF